MKKFAHLCLLATGFSFQFFAQNAPFNLRLEPMEIAGLPGLQSYAFGQYDGKWLILGGRLDGLHRRQPFAAFDSDGRNRKIYVVDPVGGQQWSALVAALPAPLREQLGSTNMQFHQEGQRLYLTGGYGFSETAGDHITFAKLTVVDVPGAMAAVMGGSDLGPHFRQVSDAVFEVTGGRMAKIYDVFQLVGGQKFEGRYNPMGPTHGPGFVQIYTEQVRRFQIEDDGNTLKINHLPPLTDAEELHRRDYNVVPQILPDGRQGLTAFSGVFQKTADFPYLNCVNIDSAGLAPVAGFSQFYNHYHCPTLPLHDASTGEMHTVFFGGIAQFYDNAGTLVQDNAVPFVSTIARVTRRPDGSMQEFKMPVEMPALLGAGAEFIPAEGLAVWENGVVKLDELPADSVFVGYIFGGIASTERNVFFINDGTQSVADRRIFKVFLTKNAVSGTHQLNAQSTGKLRLRIFPNPNNGVFGVKFNLEKTVPVWLTIADSAGKIIDRASVSPVFPGENVFTRQLPKIGVGNAYTATLEIPGETATVKMLVQE